MCIINYEKDSSSTQESIVVLMNWVVRGFWLYSHIRHNGAIACAFFLQESDFVFMFLSLQLQCSKRVTEGKLLFCAVYVSARKLLNKNLLFEKNHYFHVRGSSEEEKCCNCTVLIDFI